MAVARLDATLPDAITKQQRLMLIQELSGVQSDVVSAILAFTESMCNSLTGDELVLQYAILCVYTAELITQTDHKVLAPPVEDCVVCGRGLVSYHRCSAILYTLNGAYEDTIHCDQLINAYDPV